MLLLSLFLLVACGDDDSGDGAAAPTGEEGEGDADDIGHGEEEGPEVPEAWEPFRADDVRGHAPPGWDRALVDPSELDAEVADEVDIDPEILEQASNAMEESGEPLLLFVLEDSAAFVANINILPCQGGGMVMPGPDDIVSQYDASGFDAEVIEDGEHGVSLVRAQISETFDTYQAVVGTTDCVRFATLSVEAGDETRVSDFALFTELLEFGED